MRGKLTVFLPLLFLSAAVFGAELNNEIRFSSLTSFAKGFPAAAGAENKYTTSTNYLFLSSSAMFTRTLGAEGVFSAGNFYYNDGYQSGGATKIAANTLAAKFNSGAVLLKAGRLFYGEKNTLLPYYGLYENYSGIISSSVDGGYGAADITGYLNLSALYGKETKDNFSEDNGTVYGAVLSVKPAAGFEIAPFAFAYQAENNGYKKDLRMYGGYADLNMGGGASLYLSYAANGGKYKLTDNVFGGRTEFDYPGHAFLVRFNGDGETKSFFYNLRVLYLESSGLDGDERGFEGINQYVPLGSIFSGTNFIQRSGIIRYFNIYRYGTADGLRAYNIGASFGPKAAKFIKIDIDMFSYYDTNSYGFTNARDIGTEINAGITVTPFKNVSLSAVYAKFTAGQRFLNEYPPAYFDAGDITQTAFKAAVKF